MSGLSQALPRVSYPATGSNISTLPGQYLQPANQPHDLAPRYTCDPTRNPNVPSSSAGSGAYSMRQPALKPNHQHRVSDPENVVYTEQQSIHISRLPHDITQRELHNLVSHSGTVSNLYIKRGKEKRCSATAQYKTTTEAAHAIRDLDGKKLGKMTLVVRYDRSEAGSGSSAPSTGSKGSDSDSSTCRLASRAMQSRTGPLVVDGARGPGYHKRREDDDDSESMADSSDEEKHATGMLSTSVMC